MYIYIEYIYRYNDIPFLQAHPILKRIGRRWVKDDNISAEIHDADILPMSAGSCRRGLAIHSQTVPDL